MRQAFLAMRRGLLSAALALLLAGALGAQSVTAPSVSAPVLRGVLGMGRRQVALFELPGQSGNWQGEAGMTVPGTAWKLTRVKLNPGQVELAVPGRSPVTLGSGETYTGGPRAVRAPEVARPSNAAPAEYLAPPIPAEESAVGRRRALEAVARRRISILPGSQFAFPDISRDSPPLAAFADVNFDTAVMVVSSACPRCDELKPQVMNLPARRPHTRVVFAEVGKDERGGINWTAPFMQAHNIKRTPYFFLLDPAGRLVREGDAAEQQILRWLAADLVPQTAGSGTSK